MERLEMRGLTFLGVIASDPDRVEMSKVGQILRRVNPSVGSSADLGLGGFNLEVDHEVLAEAVERVLEHHESRARLGTPASLADLGLDTAR